MRGNRFGERPPAVGWGGERADQRQGRRDTARASSHPAKSAALVPVHADPPRCLYARVRTLSDIGHLRTGSRQNLGRTGEPERPMRLVGAGRVRPGGVQFPPSVFR